MKNLVLIAAASAAFVAPQVASAQALPAAIIAVVDINRASSQCNACKVAVAGLEGQINALKALQAQLDGGLQTEARSIQTAVTALNGKQPDAALTARAKAFEQKQSDAQRQLQVRQAAFERNRGYVFKQIGDKLDPVVTSVMARRGATVMLDTSNAVRFSPAIDVTSDVIAGLNASLTSVNTTAPATAAPQGR